MQLSHFFTATKTCPNYYALLISDGVSRLGFGLETHFCDSRSRRFQVSSRSRRFQVSRLGILQRNGLLNFL